MIRRHTVRLSRSAVRVGHALGQAAVRQLNRVWSAHCCLIRDNAGYAATVGAAAAAAVTQSSWGDVIAVVICAAVAIWTAVRTGNRNQPPSHRGPQFTDDLEAWS